MFAEKPFLEGTRARLRPFTSADIEAMGPILADPEVLRLTGSVHSTAEARDRPESLDGPTRRWYESRSAQTDRLDLAVVDAATDLCVGEVVLNECSPEDESCNLRILLGRQGQDRGIGSDALRLMMDHAFRATPLHRISLEVYAFNPRARWVYERLGFVVEGTKRDALKFDGSFVDAIGMSVLRPEWTARSAGPAAQ